MKKAILGAVVGLSLLGFSATGLTNNVQASTRVTSVKYKNIKDTTVHVAKGTMYSTTKLSKVSHYAKNYKYTSFKRTEQATIKKSNGKKYVYQYVKSGSVKGWIWHSYVKNGKAPKRPNVVLKTTNMKDAKVHVASGTMYTTAKLSKVAHYGKNYKYTTFTKTEQASVRKSNGKTYTYQYIKSGSVKGWIWSGYVKAGNAPRSFSSYNLAFQDYAQGTGLGGVYGTPILEGFDDMGNELIYNYNEDVANSTSSINKNITAFQNIYNLFKGRFSKSQQTHLSAMITKVRALPTSSDDDIYEVQEQLVEISQAMGEVIETF
ncbi:hypothetical protein A7K95_08035 [Pediococcus parvulus]|uniref:D-alanyl-D-alanine carboxypeptidase n=1 Tax=Pediococcus parvulus TaxID=54062 RepID=A0AAP5TF62_9LACO|nr:hypothetical protein [Pediococcus parvulus]MDV7694617.1 hypothetical protein [Pediococcus parvulus]OAD63804.1 hypothetical protein A7K95_08035 [Pediococcus parvulus]